MQVNKIAHNGVYNSLRTPNQLAQITANKSIDQKTNFLTYAKGKSFLIKFIPL